MPLYKRIPKYLIAAILLIFVVSGFILVLPSLGIVNQPLADGLRDTNFYVGEYKGINGTSKSVNVTEILSNGKILIGGTFTSYNGVTVNNIARLNSDGSVDTTFNSGGAGADSSVYCIKVLSDGKILVGGYFSNYNGVAKAKLVKLNSDGSIDTTFNASGVGPNASVNTILELSDGKIIIGGGFSKYNTVIKANLARLNSDGTLDTTFNNGNAGPNNGVETVVVEADGKLLVGGSFTTYNGTSSWSLARLNADGTLSAAHTGFEMYSDIYKITIVDGGKIYVAGYRGDFQYGVIRRLNSNLSFDTSFAPGVGPNTTVKSFAVQSDGKVVIVGDFFTYQGISKNYILRLTNTGSIDDTFDIGTGVKGSGLITVALQSDGKLIIGGRGEVYNGKVINCITRLNTDGTIDSNWGYSTGLNGAVLASDVDTNGKIMVTGDFTYFDQSSMPRIARFNADGTVDSTFTPGYGASASVNAIKLQSDGKILIGGLFTGYNGTARNRIARINADGTLDTSFTPGTGATVGVYSIQLQSDEKIIIGGAFTSYNGTSISRIARLNSDGTLDTSFTPGTGADGTISAIQILTNGKILIAGAFTTYNGTSISRIARLNSDGTLDTSFTPGTGANGAINAMKLMSDGKIIIGGAFTAYNGTNIGSIAILNSDGTLDIAFAPSSGANGNVNAIQIQDDGKIFIGGAFTTFNGTARNRVAKINADGTLASAFAPGDGASNVVNTILLRTEGLYVGGNFMFFNNNPAAFFVRLGLADVIAPTGSILIADDASTTSTKSVNLSLTAQDNQSGVSEMMICNDMSFTECVWESFASTKTWNLVGDSGTKTVYVKFKDGSGIVSSIYSDTIVLALPVVEETVALPAQTTKPTYTSTTTTPTSTDTTPVDNTTQETKDVLTTVKLFNENGTPIAGARVEIDGKTYITDSKGAIKISNFNETKKHIAKISYNGKSYSEEILGVEEDLRKIVIDTVEDVKDESTEEVEKGNIPWYYYVGFSVLLSVIVVIVLGRKKKDGVNKPEGYTTGDIQ